MKKFLSILLLVFCIYALFACNAKVEKEKQAPPPEIYTIPLGNYQDNLSERATMTVSFKNKVYCFEINWGSSAWENTNWVFSGTYDPTIGGVAYDNSICTNEIYNENGECTKTVVYNGGKGKMIYKNKELLWFDDQEERQFTKDYNCVFVKVEYED